MSSISAKDLMASLGKTRDMGLVEEGFDLCGHNLVVRNLRPTEVEAVLDTCKGLEDLAYVNGYQRGHVARGLVELDGFDLREVDFIDDEEPDPKRPGSLRKIRTERHKWVADKLLLTWGSEVIFAVFRKIGDCTSKADILAKDGVTFSTLEESPEEKFRRVIGELKELEDDMPAALLDRTLDEFGFMRKSTAEELRVAEDRLSQLRREQEAAEEAKAEPAPEEPTPGVASAKDIMAARKPLNQEEAPPPERAQPPQAAQPPPQVVPATRAPQPVQPSRAAQLAALEADADVAGVMSGQMPSTGPDGIPLGMGRPTEVAEIGGGSRQPLDSQQQARDVASIIDQPPPAGINPRFRPPPR